MEALLQLGEPVIEAPEGIAGPFGRHIAAGQLAQPGQGLAGALVSIERITQQEVAEIAGTTLFTVSRTLKEWEEQGIVEVGRQRYRIRDLGRLGRAGEGM